MRRVRALASVRGTGDERPLPDRRAFLGSLGGACGVAVLAGCGGAPGDGASDVVHLEVAPEGSVTLSLKEHPELASNGGSLTAAWPGEGNVLILRDDEGRFRATSAQCTHMNCPVRYNALNVLVECLCHGSKFELDGTVLSGPATKPLPTYEAELDGDLLKLRPRR